MAAAVGAEVVVVHPPFRWQKEYAAGFVDGIAALEESTGIAFAVENMYPWKATSRRGIEMYLPGWDPSEEDYANTTIDLSHAAIAASDPVEMAIRLGDRLRHIHLTDGTGSAKDEHLVPGRGVHRRGGVPRAMRRAPASPARSWSRSTPASAPTARSASATCASRWSSPACTSRWRRHDAASVRRGRRPGAPDTRAAILDAARDQFAAQGFGRTTIRGVAGAAGVDPALVHHYFGTKHDLFVAALELPFDPRDVIGPVRSRGPRRRGRAAAHRLPRRLGRPRAAAGAARRRPRHPRAGGPLLIRDGFLPAVVRPSATALGLDQPERRMPFVASQIFGLIMARYVLEIEPLASMPAEEVWRSWRPDHPAATSRCPCPDGPLPARPLGRIIQHMMNNAVEVATWSSSRGQREVLRGLDFTIPSGR